MSLKLTITASLICFALLLGILVPASALDFDGLNTQGFSRPVALYSNFTAYSQFEQNQRYDFPAFADAQQGSKLDRIEEMKNRTSIPSVPATEPGTPVPTPSPAPFPERDIAQNKLQELAAQKAEIEARMNSLKTQGTVNFPQTQTGRRITTPLSENGNAVLLANNQFAFDLYRWLASDPGHAGTNIFFSPWSISSAFALTYEGARGNTADEIRSVFHFPASTATLREGYSELSTRLNSRKSGYTLSTANALWAEKSHPFLPDYISTADRHYGAETTNLDFINQPEASRIAINRWVADQTSNHIRDLLPAGSIHPLTRLVITNAIYFKGTWVKQFDTAKTVERDFHVTPSQAVRVQMMSRTDKDAMYWYTETDTLQVLGMPYAQRNGRELSMLVLLPKGHTIEAVELSLDAQSVADLNQALEYRRVHVYFPRFRMETTYGLNEVLSDMGMPGAFIWGVSDLSGMDGTRDLFIDCVFHKAYMDVNEEGTEAAAATAVGVAMAYSQIPMEPIPVFCADHPFIFLIQESDTGNILFMGRMMNPAGP